MVFKLILMILKYKCQSFGLYLNIKTSFKVLSVGGRKLKSMEVYPPVSEQSSPHIVHLSHGAELKCMRHQVHTLKRVHVNCFKFLGKFSVNFGRLVERILNIYICCCFVGVINYHEFLEMFCKFFGKISENLE